MGLIIAPLISLVGSKIVLIIAAVIPAIVLLTYIYKQDRLEKEPEHFIRHLVFMGIISTCVAVMLERLGTGILDLFFNENSLIYQILLYFVVVGLSEEASKFTVLDRQTWCSPYFNCKFDGIIYSVSISLGFALWENIKYVLMYGFKTALLRAITAVPGHACFGVFMGIWYGLAKRCELEGDKKTAKSCRTLAIIMPSAIHGLYDFIATNVTSGLVFAIFVFVLFVLSFVLVRRLSKTDGYLKE